MLDAKATELELVIAGRDFTIAQSPGILQSRRKGGTTGAAVWQTSVRVAEWLARPPVGFTQLDILNPERSVLELGSGISGLVPCVLASRVKSVIATDQSHLLKGLRENIEANSAVRWKPMDGKPSKRNASRRVDREASDNITVRALDWEQDDIRGFMEGNGILDGVDVVMACDCIFNYALIEPFVTTCVDICRLRQPSAGAGEEMRRPTVCIIAQQLRQSEVFDLWLQAALRSFRVWRMPGGWLGEGLKERSGFVVHVCVLRE